MESKDSQHKDTGKKADGGKITVALLGNPNVGKSTVFNGITGLRQHTGNWPGKTVMSARGEYTYRGATFELVDLPGTYSLMPNSAEEEVARDFLVFSKPRVAVVVADATCLERNLNLVLQVMEATGNVILCVNLMDEAKKKKITVDIAGLSQRLGVPVVAASAREGKGLKELMEAVSMAACAAVPPPFSIGYRSEIEQAISSLQTAMDQCEGSRWAALRLLEGEKELLSHPLFPAHLDPMMEKNVEAACAQALDVLAGQGINRTALRDEIVKTIITLCEKIAGEAVLYKDGQYSRRDRALDRILTSRLTGIPIMLLLLLLIFWITMAGANAPSALLSKLLFSWMKPISEFLGNLALPAWLIGLLVDGMYKTLAWVVSVMLPPMAIFFPLFTLMEDLGYLPRVAFNLDHFFQKAGAHGKQSLTMCMGFGCNACGVTGCRIIDSPRERLIAMLTNSFVPCNGRFPTLIVLITVFFAPAGGFSGSAAATVWMTAVVVLGVCVTLFVSKLLSRTLLRGVPSSFQLELPPFRRPQVGRVIFRSVMDRTLFVLLRAVSVAAPAGIVIFLMANIKVGSLSMFGHCALALDPLAHLMGLDGNILTAFILGFPANEIVIPILLMSYLSGSSLTEYQSLAQLHTLLVNNGWTGLTALCAMLFSLMHWPCGTTLITLYRETGSIKWTVMGFLIPTILGILACMLTANIARMFGLA